MTSDQYGQIVYNEHDIVDLLMQGRTLTEFTNLLVDDSVCIDQLAQLVVHVPQFVAYTAPTESVAEFDQQQQSRWHMPDEYQQLDIAEHVLSLCQTQEELQRCGEELLLYQERNLFDLLRYLKYLVDTMKQHQVIWGVGRGSSVASYVLYLLEVHRINSMYYNLDIREFLR
jgi:DNA polymerase III alpha subunit